MTKYDAQFKLKALQHYLKQVANIKPTGSMKQILLMCADGRWFTSIMV